MSAWTSKTGQFRPEEMARMEAASTGELANMIAASDPLVILRALTEIKLNGASDTLAELLAYEVINRLWRDYTHDPQANAQDHGYADEIGKIAPALPS